MKILPFIARGTSYYLKMSVKKLNVIKLVI
ncbi:choline binding protein D [Streptococcus pneumoniae]|nr:choline binding protein D [Streptococcus pneumoniae]